MQPQAPRLISPFPIQDPRSHTRWQALIHRTPAFHSSFLYGVTSTKIYCRPTCSARRARRANVVFFDTREQTREEGYRACRRCRPDEEGFMEEGEEIVERTIGLLREGGGGRGVGRLAREMGVSRSWLCRVFKRVMGVTVGEYGRGFEGEGSGEEGEKERGRERNVDMSGGGGETQIVMSEQIKTAGFAGDASVECVKGRSVEENGRDDEDALDLDLNLDSNFSFDQWFENEYTLSNGIYGRDVEDYSVLPMMA